MIWLACSVMWISFAAVTIIGLLITKSAWCLWIMLIPAMIGYSSTHDDEKIKENGADKNE